jgi:hypothetical protein
MKNIWSNETTEERESRLAMSACLNADMIFRGVRDGLCYFDLYYASPEHSGPKVTLSLPTEGLTADKIANHAAAWDRMRHEKQEKREKCKGPK